VRVSETTVFQSGNSQAVRLPKEFRFQSKTVEIFRRGNEVVLREKPLTLGELLGGWEPLSAEDCAALDEMMATINEPQPPDNVHKKLQALYENAPAKRRAPQRKR
jgi:antitoxin VapB